MATKKKAKPLTKAQRQRMATDRVNELCNLLGLKEVDEEAFEAAEEEILACYDADIESGKELA